jgi:hypothetical protein
MQPASLLSRSRSRLACAAISAAAVLAAAPAAPLAAQGGGFQAGDLYLHTPAYPLLKHAIVRIDPGSGAQSVLVDLTGGSTSDQIAYDPWRDRLIFFGGLTINHTGVYLIDAAGNVQSIGIEDMGSFGLFSPRGDGLIYLRSSSSWPALSYLDGANQLHTLMDASGTAPYAFPTSPGNIRRMVYHAGTNALFAATQSAQSTCAGGVTDAANVYKLELSADGTRVVAESCTQWQVKAGASGQQPVCFAPGPGGDLLLQVKGGGADSLPHVVRVQPESFTLSTFASPAIGGMVSGCYSQVLGRAVVQDSGDDVLRTYAPGELGGGTILCTGVGPSGSFNEVATLIEIVPGASGFGMTGTPGALSVAAGGAQAWTIAFGPAHAGELHLVAGSLTGWAPATSFGGTAVPLVFDGYSLWTLSHQNSAVLSGSFGVLDGQGQASAAFVLPPAAGSTLVGVVAYHAALALTGGGVVTAATNPVPLALVP